MHAAFPLPEVDWEPLASFWNAAARDTLVLPRCDACGRLCWYPRRACPACAGESFRWSEVQGRGTLFSWSVVRHPFLPQFAALTPYVTALVALDEDPAVRFATRVVGAQPDDLIIDQPMTVVFDDLTFPGVEGAVRAPLWTPDQTN
jgi:uncharacterized protein